MAIETQGTRVYWSTSTVVSTSTEAFVAAVVDLSGPNSQGSEIDITTFDSTAKEFLMGLKDEGSISINIIRDTSSTGQGRLISDQAARNQRMLTIDFSTLVMEASVIGSRLAGLAYVQSFSYTAGADDAVKAAVNFRITGAIETTKQTS
jgi:hypothetical protein